MAEKLINTRIALKIDTFENWSKTTVAGQGANLVLKRGEIGLCEIPKEGNGSGEAQTAPTILFKVGDGKSTFADLKWASALAADVYGWAKKSEDEFKTWLSNTAGFATDAEVKAITDSLAADIDDIEAYFDGGKAKTALDAEKLGGVEASKYAKLTDVEAASHTHTNKTVLDGITAEKVAAWDVAEQNAKTYAKDYTDELAATVSSMDEAYKAADTGLDTRIQALEAIDHSHTFVESELNEIKTGDVAKWNAAEQNAKDYAKSYADGLAGNYDQKGAASAAEAAAKSYTDGKFTGVIGTVPTNKTVVTMISDAETAAKSYADGLAGNYDAKGSAAKALTDAKDYTDELAATVSSMDTAYKQADTALSGRLDTVEGKLANVTNVMDFRGAVTAVPTDVSSYQSGDVIVVTDGDDKGKEFVFDKGKFIEFGNVDAQQTAIAGLQGRMTTAEGDIDKLEQSVAGLSAEDTKIREAFAKADADLQTAINGKVAQSDFNTLSGKVTTLEGKPAVGITATQISNWDGEVGAKAAAATNASAISALDTRIDDLEKIDHTHTNKTVLDGITSQNITDWNDAVSKEHTHSNKTELDLIKSGDVAKWNGEIGAKAATATNASAISALDTRVVELEKVDHDHTNKTVLDGITAAKVTAWDDAVSKEHTHSNSTELGLIKTGDVAKWNNEIGAKQAAATNASDISALDSRIDAYDERFGSATDILVFDCGTSTTNI